MTNGMLTLILIFISYLAGFLGALTGLGGGVILIPLLVLFLHIHIYYAMGTALIAVIATSSGAAIAYLKDGYTNIRIAMLLELGAVAGAMIGASLTNKISPHYLYILFGFVLMLSAYFSSRRNEQSEISKPSHAWATYLKLNGDYPTASGRESYSVHNVPSSLGIMTIAGIVSGLLGIGAGALKVLAMDLGLRLPYKVSTATSNFIIGITATVSAGIYFSKGYIDPGLTCPVVIGVLLGAMAGGKSLRRAPTKILRQLFSVLISLLAVQMIYTGIFNS